jgi:hypothetical protein
MGVFNFPPAGPVWMLVGGFNLFAKIRIWMEYTNPCGAAGGKRNGFG